MSSLSLYEDRLARELEGEDFAVAVVTATKPDFYKQAPLVTAADDEVLAFEFAGEAILVKREGGHN